MNLDGCFGCNIPQACIPEGFEKFTADLSAIWAIIIELRGGQPTILRATDTYIPLVAEWKRCDIFTACDTCWGNTSDPTPKAAETYNIPFLSRYDAFDSQDHSEDPREKGYIRADGEHPKEAASQFTAELLSKIGYDPVALP